MKKTITIIAALLLLFVPRQADAQNVNERQGETNDQAAERAVIKFSARHAQNRHHKDECQNDHHGRNAAGSSCYSRIF